ncbi:hypothetical protein DPEC_G00111370 [Dallia pectoralis]|uniref:Uncharacterized protein n=1 Tax=Dallia pectoralis TaxID=75939 RepID=A0ACC2GTD6_DALPE|nr:hypothetical protein DPEC_G00111370 [Dallia pectoralis]
MPSGLNCFLWFDKSALWPTLCAGRLKVKSALDRLGSRLGGTGHARRSTAVHATTGPANLGLLHTSKPLPPKHCCPNHIVCSTCNLRLRLADKVTHRFTPSLWTMYCYPPSESVHRGASSYLMPSFVACRKISASENSLRYLPFM